MPPPVVTTSRVSDRKCLWRCSFDRVNSRRRKEDPCDRWSTSPQPGRQRLRNAVPHRNQIYEE
ncbi:hypothetical protein ACHAWC_011764 [Mediolabrus comicus]